MNIVLYQPDIALNVGSIIRLCACFSATLHIIEPCGFPYDYKKIKKSALDYIDKVVVTRHSSWSLFLKFFYRKNQGSMYLFSTKAQESYYQGRYSEHDYLIFGSESRGVDAKVLEDVNRSYTIPMKNDCRSLNLSTSVAMIMGEVLRQISLAKK